MRRKRNLFGEVSGANEGMIIHDKTTFEYWLVDNKFASKNVKILDKSKTYIGDLL